MHDLHNDSLVYKTSRCILSVYPWQPFARGNCSHFIANLLAFPVKYAASTFNTNDHPTKHHTRKYPDKYDIPSTYTCHICQKSFHYEGNYRKHLTTHQPTAAAVPSAEPEETVHDLHNSLAYPADLVASLPEDCCQCYIENCSQICSCQRGAQLNQVYNQWLEMDSDIGDMLQDIFCAQKNAFKINMSFGSILSNI